MEELKRQLEKTEQEIIGEFLYKYDWVEGPAIDEFGREVYTTGNKAEKLLEC